MKDATQDKFVEFLNNKIGTYEVAVIDNTEFNIPNEIHYFVPDNTSGFNPFRTPYNQNRVIATITLNDTFKESWTYKIT